MKVPQTGSFFSASAVGIGRCGQFAPPLEPDDEDGPKRSETPFMIIPITDRSRVITSTAITASRMTRIYFVTSFSCFVSRPAYRTKSAPMSRSMPASLSRCRHRLHSAEAPDTFGTDLLYPQAERFSRPG